MKHTEDDRWLVGVRQAYAAATTGELVDPPEWVTARARRLFVAGHASSSSLLQRVRASLIFDSRRPNLATAGVRAMATLEGALEGPWQLLYRGGDMDVDLLVRPNQDGRTMNVRGQALSLAGDTVEAGVVEALRSDVPRKLHGVQQFARRTHVQSSGEFSLPNLERGRYDVLLRFGAREIELNGVEL